jgi:hypothetical protein
VKYTKGDEMKSRLLFTTSTVGLLALLAMPVRLVAQEGQQEAAHFQHYIVTELHAFRAVPVQR